MKRMLLQSMHGVLLCKLQYFLLLALYSVMLSPGRCEADEWGFSGIVCDGVHDSGAQVIPVAMTLKGCETYSGRNLLVAGTNVTATVTIKNYYPDWLEWKEYVAGSLLYSGHQRHRLTGIIITQHAACELNDLDARRDEVSTFSTSFLSPATNWTTYVCTGENFRVTGLCEQCVAGADNCYTVEATFTLKEGDGWHGKFYWSATAIYDEEYEVWLHAGDVSIRWDNYCGTHYSCKHEAGEDVYTIGSYLLVRDETGWVFFMKDEMDDGKVPNWFRYWRDDGAVPQLKGAGFEAVPTFDGLFTSGGGNDVVFGGDINAWGKCDSKTHEIKLFPRAGDGHYYAQNADGRCKYGHYRYKEWKVPNLPVNLAKFWNPSVFGIYTVECVIAHESQHLKQHDEYKAEVGEDNYRVILDNHLNFFEDTIKRIQRDYDSDIEGDFKIFGFYSLVSVERFLLKDGRVKTVQKCDQLTDTMETQTYSAYGLSPDSLDTYGLGEYKDKEYECYGDDEYLAMEAGYRAVHENSQVVEEKDWAFPGHQSFLPAPFKRMDKECVAVQHKAASNLKSAGSMPSSDAPSDGKMECSSLVPVLCPSTGDVKYDGIRYDLSFEVEGSNWIEIIGVLGDLNSNVVAHANVEQVFTRENNNCALYFDGKEIYESRRSGPYMLLGLVFLRHDDMDVHFYSAVQGFDLPNLDCDYTDFGKEEEDEEKPVEEEKYKEESVGGYAWRYVVEDGNAVISYALEYEDFKFAYLAVDPNPEGDVTVPSKLGGHAVVGIGDSAFYDCENLLTVTIPRSVTNLCENAFYSCTALTNLIFEGEAPVATEGSFHRMNQDCIVTVREGTTGWDEDHDGLWNGMRIVYRTWLPVKRFVIGLANAGWHEVSFPVLPAGGDPADVFAPVADKIGYVTYGSKNWSPLTGGTLTALEIGKGYWVQTTAANVSWTVTGQGNPDVEIALKPGWNLIGYPLLEEGEVETVLATALATGKIDWIYSGSRVYPGTLKTMAPGKGYWVYANAAATIRFDFE